MKTKNRQKQAELLAALNNMNPSKLGSQWEADRLAELQRVVDAIREEEAGE